MSELYLFSDNGTYYGFTPTLFSKTLFGITYAPAIISRSSIQLTNNFSKSSLTFTFDRLNAFANMLISSLPETPINITIYRNELVYWKGRILSAKKGMVSIVASCDSSYAASISGGRRYHATLYCNHQLYSTQCGVVQSSWKTDRVVTASSTNIALAIAVVANYFDGGIAEINGQRRRILYNTTNNIYLASPFIGVQTGILHLYPGCKLTEDACSAFGNLENGLMFARMPSKNPMGTEGLL